MPVPATGSRRSAGTADPACPQFRCSAEPLFLLLTAILAGCTVSLSTPTTAPPAASPAALTVFQSGGIGLTKATWDRSHSDIFTPPTGDYFIYDGGRYEVTFWHDLSQRTPTADSMISMIAFDTQAHTPETQLAAFRPFLPADAQREPPTPYAGREIWYSPSLVNRYPTLTGALQPWGKAGAGRISVIFKNGNSDVRIVAYLNYPQAPRPVPPTPILCGDHPCPDPTYALPTPVPTKILPPLRGIVSTAVPRTLPSYVAPLPNPTAAPAP